MLLLPIFMRIKILLYVGFTFGCLQSAFGEQSVTSAINTQGIATRALETVQAEALIRAGLPGSADAILRIVLSEEDVLNEKLILRARFGLVEALVMQFNFKEAQMELLKIPAESQNGLFWLHSAVASYGTGESVNWQVIKDQLAKIEVEGLPKASLYWYYLMQALKAENNGNSEVLLEALSKASERAELSYERAMLGAISLRQILTNRPVSDESLKLLKQNFASARGASVYSHAKQYALALWSRGDVNEALKILNLDKQLKRYGTYVTLEQREQLRLLRAMMQGEATTEGQMALAELIRSGQSRETMEIALHLMSLQSSESSIFTDLLNEIIAREEAHALVGQMYYLRSQLALIRGELDLAKSDAELMLDNYPGLERIADAFLVLAFAALQSEPPQYRTAANFLTQMRDQAVDTSISAELNERIGDCYYLNGDFKNAIEFYGLALVERPESLGRLFLRVATASIQAGQLDTALLYVDQMPLNNTEVALERWQAEWNIAQGLIKDARGLDALSRIRELIQVEQSAIPLELELRLRWLALKLSLEFEPTIDRAAISSQISQHLERLSESAELSPEAAALTAEFLLLKSIVLYRSNEVENANAVLLDLRSRYPESIASQRSYALQAAEMETLGELEAAQGILLELVDQYPQSGLATQALFEAAIMSERRGSEFYIETIKLYDQLANAYPDSELVYRARLRQGDLLRLLNDFSGAQLVYETLINTYPEDKLRPIAELSRAESMLALANDDPAKFAKVSSSLERLVDLPNLDLDFRVEAMYKWAFALQELGASAEARAVLAQSIARNLLDTKSAAALGSAGRYWAARTMLELGEQLHLAGELKEAKMIYRKLIAYNLPGRGLAQTRVNSIQIIKN
jgi:TolA-binding protein